MQRIELVIKALSPLLIGKRKPGGSIAETENYIPGSVIRGALAGQMLRQAGLIDQDSLQTPEPVGDFADLFVADNAAIFTNAYPATRSRRSQVIPATAVSSKSNPGFRTEQVENGGVFDTLIDRFCAEGHGHLYDPNCPTDGDRVEPFQCFFSVEGNYYQQHSVETRLLTRVGINRRRATAQDQILYSTQVINESQQNGQQETFFTGSIFLEQEPLANLLIQYLQQSHLRIGGSTSRGLGKVALEANLSNSESTISTRVNRFNQQLKSRWQQWSNIFGPSTLLPEQRTFFSLGLQSEAILREEWLRTMVLSPEMLQQAANIQDPELISHAVYSSYSYRSGWNSAWGLMKDLELVTNPGSVFLFSTSNFERWLPVLERLEIKGIGDRRQEGFGQVEICSEFHSVLREDAV